ncbi:TIGR03745 family integrating conjugative element membrane protein [Klebsiella variicola]|uniref:TIGR03745 family integrating conjugative element membrane protein n=1 Tax=Klebsiella variicola TaxID=244366 RepID=UPI000D70432B|nr:TIGR03745 family integrating conjugative element membrane protein [Klebsiella variicola]MBY5172966.1 TIGR03745 family integrating conjugative element membrane protein [Klebsiella variicola]
MSRYSFRPLYWSLVWLCCLTGPALANLPTTQNSSSGTSGSNYIDRFKGYVADGAVLLGLIICVYAFIVVANAITTEFNQVREKQTTWGKFGVLCVVGVVLLVVVIWLLNLAADILL